MNADQTDALVTALQRRLGRAWADMVRWLRDNNQLGDIVERIESGDIGGAVQGIEAAAKTFAAEQNAAFTLAAQRSARWLNDEVGSRAVIRYDVANERAVSWMRQNTLELVRGLEEETRSIVHAAMVDGLARGDNPRVIAREIQDSLGLTPQQLGWVDSYRRSLSMGDFSDAIGRELANGRYDRSIMAAARDGRPLPPEQVDRMVDQYRQGVVRYRATMIARTEGQRSAYQGQEELFQGAVDDGKVDQEDLISRWKHGDRGPHARWFHETMNGQQRTFGEPFQSGLGNDIMFPGDPDAPPEETIHCRCLKTVRYIRRR